ncbi:MAG: endonuclease III [Candidatus Gygaella obscura]|nr:endonuclease III [Candidatus Gygaella obscura]
MQTINRSLALIEKMIADTTVPSVTQFAEEKDPFIILISCVLSLRTKDKTTISASKRLFHVAKTPQALSKLSLEEIRRLIYPVGFYRNKAKQVREIAKIISEKYNNKVPDTLDELLVFKGVGIKTANLVLGLGFNKPAICVDTHVHRISNRLDWVNTKNAQETLAALESLIPKRKWIRLNTTLVGFGQNICLASSPLCLRCTLNLTCAKKGVKKCR